MFKHNDDDLPLYILGPSLYRAEWRQKMIPEYFPNNPINLSCVGYLNEVAKANRLIVDMSSFLPYSIKTITDLNINTENKLQCTNFLMQQQKATPS